MWHRQNWNVVYPNLSMDNEAEVKELGQHGTYVAGFLDSSVQARSDLYDLFVNGELVCSVIQILSVCVSLSQHSLISFHSPSPSPVPAASITVAPHAKGSINFSAKITRSRNIYVYLFPPLFSPLLTFLSPSFPPYRIFHDDQTAQGHCHAHDGVCPEPRLH